MSIEASFQVKSRRKYRSNFLESLFDILEVNIPYLALFHTSIWKQNNEFADLIGWSEGGRSFYVQNHYEFANTVLPRFFKHNNFSSFTRQVKLLNNIRSY